MDDRNTRRATRRERMAARRAEWPPWKRVAHRVVGVAMLGGLVVVVVLVLVRQPPSPADSMKFDPAEAVCDTVDGGSGFADPWVRSLLAGEADSELEQAVQRFDRAASAEALDKSAGYRVAALGGFHFLASECGDQDAGRAADLQVEGLVLLADVCGELLTLGAPVPDDCWAGWWDRGSPEAAARAHFCNSLFASLPYTMARGDLDGRGGGLDQEIELLAIFRDLGTIDQEKYDLVLRRQSFAAGIWRFHLPGGYCESNLEAAEIDQVVQWVAEDEAAIREWCRAELTEAKVDKALRQVAQGYGESYDHSLVPESPEC